MTNAQIRHIENFTDTALEDLRAELPLVESEIQLYGKTHKLPRLISWHGAGSYTFSRRTFEPAPWGPILATVRDAVTLSTGVRFNACLANLYRTGADSVNWHADDEAGFEDVIASVSIGAKRKFRIREKATGETVDFMLGGGDLLVMKGIQHTHLHCVPKTKKHLAPRLNLTFRLLK